MFIPCECGTPCWWWMPYCEGCGAQPPRPAGTGRMDRDMSEENPEEFCATVIALTEALEMHNGKWAVA